MERDDNYWKIYSVDTEISETLEESLQTYGKKLFLNFKCVGFEEVVITRTSKGGAIPRTDRAIAKISSSSLSGIDNFSFHPIVRNFPQVKMKLDLNQVYRVSELVFLTFVPFSNIKIPLFMKWGIAISEIDLIVIAGDGRPKSIKNFESHYDLEIMKIPKYGNFQIQSQDKTLFLKVGSAPSSWPEKSWEVESALVILHIEEVFKFLKPPTPILSPLATLGNAINIMHLLKDVSIDIGFYYPFGQSLKADYFGHIKVEFTSPSEVGCNRDYPHPFNSVSHFYSSFWEDTKWDKKKFSADCSVTRFPPSEGFLAISFLNCEDEVISTWVTAYQLSPIQEDEVKKDLYTFVGVQIKTTRTTIYQSHLRRDFGMRKFSRVLLSFELKASKGKIYIGNVRFRTPTLLVFPRATITS